MAEDDKNKAAEAQQQPQASSASATAAATSETKPPSRSGTPKLGNPAGDNALVSKHPLQHKWAMWYDNPGKKTNQASWHEHLKIIITFDTVEDFWRLFNNIVPASALVSGSNYHLFKEGVEPKWEDPTNAQGGKWVITNSTKTRKEIDKLWMWTVLAVIGENFAMENEICGAVVSIRKQQDKIALWTKNASNDMATISIGRTWKRLLEFPETVTIGYQAHVDSLRRNSSFNNKSRYEV